MMQQGRPPLSWGTPLREDAPHDTLQIIVRGLQPPAGGAGGDGGGPQMPGYAADFNDRELAAIAAYLRARFTELPPWSHLEQAAAQVRKAADE
jgi:nicotinate dehydrogenase subunit B